jgi:hypothetical protein
LERKIKWKELLIYLRNEEYLDEKLSNEELDFIIFLSVSVRGTYFQMTNTNSYNKNDYTKITNQLLKPYLSTKGLAIYNDWLKAN